MFKEGEVVEIRHVEGNYKHPYIGRKGTIISITKQKPMNHYQVELIGEPSATLTLFENELLFEK